MRESTDTYLERSHLALIGRCCVLPKGHPTKNYIAFICTNSTHETSALPLLQDASDVSVNIWGYPRFSPHVPAALGLTSMILIQVFMS